MFISVKEAADLTGKSPTTIYRLCNKRINTLYVRKEDNKFLIDKDYLLATYPQEVYDNVENENEESIELRSKQLRNSNIEKNNSYEFNEPAVVLQKNGKKLIDTQEAAVAEPGEVKKITALEFENETPKTFYQNIISWEVFLGVSGSLLIIAIFIYLLLVYNV